jgi:hypothetical protein
VGGPDDSSFSDAQGPYAQRAISLSTNKKLKC